MANSRSLCATQPIKDRAADSSTLVTEITRELTVLLRWENPRKVRSSGRSQQADSSSEIIVFYLSKGLIFFLWRKMENG